MSKALSVDLRQGVVDAVHGGSSCRAAAARFGVGVSSAIRWVARARTRGDLTPDKRGGNVRSGRIDEHRDFLLALITAEPDLTLAEVAERLDVATGYRPLPSVVCRFFQRQSVTRKKRRRMPPNRTDRTQPNSAKPGSRANRTLIQSVWCSSTSAPPRRRWPGCMAARRGASDAALRSRTDTGTRRPSSARSDGPASRRR